MLSHKKLIEILKSGKLKEPGKPGLIEGLEIKKYIPHDMQIAIIDNICDSCIVKTKNMYNINHVLKNIRMIMIILENFTNITHIDQLAKSDISKQIKFCDLIKYEYGFYDAVKDKIRNYEEVEQLIDKTIDDKLNRLNSIENVVGDKVDELMEIIKKIDPKKAESTITKILKNIDFKSLKGK